MVASFLSTAISLIATVAFVATLTNEKSVALRSFVLPALAVIVTSPALTPVTTPFSSTFAIVSSLEAKVTFVLAGFTVVVICSVAPTATTSAAFTVREGFLTVIVAFNVFFTALPDFLPVTLTRYSDRNIY